MQVVFEVLKTKKSNYKLEYKNCIRIELKT
jgi:hypothetical protein